MTQHFLSLLDLSEDQAQTLIQRAIELKAKQKAGEAHEYFKNKVMGMIFDKSSTRTRVSFEAGMIHFGGYAIFLSPRDTQLGRCCEPSISKILSFLPSTQMFLLLTP